MNSSMTDMELRDLANKIIQLHSTSGSGHAPIDYELDRCASCILAEGYIKLLARSSVIREALEWYGDCANYFEDDPRIQQENVLYDNGDKARDCLAKLNKVE